MAEIFRTVAGLGARTIVINNAPMVPSSLVTVPSNQESSIVVGHLSNLSQEKGLGVTLDLVESMRTIDPTVRAVVAGPATTTWARDRLEAAAHTLGSSLDYRGHIDDAGKLLFFRDITHFVFPTSYVNEAEPLVIYEALAAGRPTVATDVGSISEQLSYCENSRVISPDEDFVALATEYLFSIRDRVDCSVVVRRRYLDALARAESGIAEVVAFLKGLNGA
tara:strand:+ start:684 stop:1346 length:663 start_codon:yes stop_codon:yes gene_type:complete